MKLHEPLVLVFCPLDLEGEQTRQLNHGRLKFTTLALARVVTLVLGASLILSQREAVRKSRHCRIALWTLPMLPKTAQLILKRLPKRARLILQTLSQMAATRSPLQHARSLTMHPLCRSLFNAYRYVDNDRSCIGQSATQTGHAS
jgi:hypothetical protein